MLVAQLQQRVTVGGRLPELAHFGDHRTAAVSLSMNTGLRRGEFLKLRWPCIDLANQVLTVDGATSRARRTRYVPLNSEAMSVLARWREQGRYRSDVAM